MNVCSNTVTNMKEPFIIDPSEIETVITSRVAEVTTFTRRILNEAEKLPTTRDLQTEKLDGLVNAFKAKIAPVKQS